MYPIASTLPATLIITPLVELEISASPRVISSFSPASFFCSMPISSTNAPLVPEPSSRDTTVMSVSSLEAVLSEAVESAAELSAAELLLEEALVVFPEQPANAAAISRAAALNVIFLVVIMLFSFNILRNHLRLCCDLSLSQAYYIRRMLNPKDRVC